nr:MAG TPA: hypothetical protein [Crassvirales sp.]
MRTCTARADSPDHRPLQGVKRKDLLREVFFCISGL